MSGAKTKQDKRMSNPVLTGAKRTHSKAPDGYERSSTISARQAMIFWITALQTYDVAQPPMLMVYNYNGDTKQSTEIDYFTDDPTNLIDGTWERPHLLYEDNNPHMKGELKK